MRKINFSKAPKWFKLVIAKILLRCLSLANLQNDIVLYNELKLWIDTEMRPITSNPNYWIDTSLKSIEINKINYELDEAVFNLILSLSKEKDFIVKNTDLSTIKKADEICIKSLDPDTAEKWEDVRDHLFLVRSNLKESIEWEFVEWSERKESLALIKGYNMFNVEYEGTAIMNGTDDILEILDIEQIKSS